MKLNYFGAASDDDNNNNDSFQQRAENYLYSSKSVYARALRLVGISERAGATITQMKLLGQTEIFNKMHISVCRAGGPCPRVHYILI